MHFKDFPSFSGEISHLASFFGVCSAVAGSIMRRERPVITPPNSVNTIDSRTREDASTIYLLEQFSRISSVIFSLIDSNVRFEYSQ